MTKPRQTVQGRDGWRFVFRDVGQHIRARDYAEIAHFKISRGSGRHGNGESRYDADKVSKKNTAAMQGALQEFKAGKYIRADMFIRLCDKYDVALSRLARCKCECINEFGISIRTLRHRKVGGDLIRNYFDGIFDAIQMLVVNTMDEK